MKAIINGNIYLDNKFERKIIIFNDKICKYVDNLNDFDGAVIDAKDNYILPGFIDIHIHGYDGYDVMDATTESLDAIRKGIVKNGVTSFLPTTMTMSKSNIINSLDNIKNSINKNIGAKVLGVHLEGPFINKKYKGAQHEDYIILPDLEIIENYKDILKIITIAPEIENANEVIKKYKDEINFSIGHTNATYEEAINAYEEGAKSTTHLFNAMTPLHHRKPGVVGACLNSDCHAELICDTFHVNSLLYNMVIKNKTIDKILLITDCIRAGNMKNGNYDLGGQNVTVIDEKCLLSDNSIAGSTLKLNQGLKNFTNYSDSELIETIKTVTKNQSKYLNEPDIGSLDIGKCSDIVIMDKNFNIQKTIIGGNIVYEV